MAFQEVTKETPLWELKKEYKKASKKYTEAKNRMMKLIDWDDITPLGLHDIIELKELYHAKTELYWKIHMIENPDDHATKEAYAFLRSMTNQEANHWLMEHKLTTHQLAAEIANNPNFLNEVEA